MRKPMNIDFERCTSGIEFEEWVRELLYTAVITIWYYWIEKSLKKCVRFEFKSCVYR